MRNATRMQCCSGCVAADAMLQLLRGSAARRRCKRCGFQSYHDREGMMDERSKELASLPSAAAAACVIFNMFLCVCVYIYINILYIYTHCHQECMLASVLTAWHSMRGSRSSSSSSSSSSSNRSRQRSRRRSDGPIPCFGIFA